MQLSFVLRALFPNRTLMPNVSHLIIGLGNPGPDYAQTRHNIGFMAVDEIAVRHGATPWKKKFRGLIAGGNSFLLLKPQTFMNLSGEAVAETLHFYSLSPDQVVVFHDDLDLTAGQVKTKQGGGTGGHNGLKSLDQHIGPTYWRIRLGIGRPVTEQGQIVKGDAVSHYVLNSFSKSDKVWLKPLLASLADEFDLVLKKNYAAYATKLGKNTTV